MNPCSKEKRNQRPIASTGLPCSSHQQKASHTEQSRSGEKPVRVKRRRTRWERNYVRFGRTGTDSVLEQRPSCWGLQKAFPPAWNSQLNNCDKPASFKGISGTKTVIITQNRISLGMFNKKVNSANIERLLDPGCEQDFVEATQLQRDSGVDKSTVSDQASIPCQQPGSSVNDLCGTNEDSLPVVIPAVCEGVTEHSFTAPINMTDPASQSSALSAAAEVNHQSELQMAEPDPCQKKKENIPPVSPAGAHKTRHLAGELAHNLEKKLNLKAIFPGRNLINETRRAIFSILLEQKQKLPTFSALGWYEKIAGGSERDAIQADFKTPVGRFQEWQLETKSSVSSRNSSPGIFSKKKRGRDVSFTSPFPSLAHTAIQMDEGRVFPGKDTDFFVKPDGFNQQSLGSTAIKPRSHLLSSQHVNPIAGSSLTPERQCPLQEAVLRTAWPWEQGLKDALWKPQSRQERAKEAYRPLQKKNVPQRPCLPFSTWDAWSPANVSPSQFPITDSRQYSELGSEQWHSQEAEPAPVHTLQFPQNQWTSQTRGVGHTEKAASESQTSFDVLKSIWSPNVPSRGARHPVPRAHGYPFLTHQPSTLRELNSDREEALQMCNISPEQNCCLLRQNPQQEMHVPGRHPLNGPLGFSGRANSRIHRQKAAFEPEGISNSHQLWGPSLASTKMQGVTNKDCTGSRILPCNWQRLSQVEGLRLLQQLPMSYFPPSEVLEHEQSPLHSLRGHRLGRSSPEPWAFPRMKLY
ncbi:uncharacterized protein LOC143837170 [Paroedura picta]|uniref:uncharacterized protein LOC143837170 n=1 Tax=Paroedura picta TaxID=143630 RepID=UPI004056A151